MTETTRINFISHPAGPLQGRLRVPGDKSISHRAIIFGAIADGVTTISGLLESEDILATAGVFREMGVRINSQNGQVTVHGAGLHGLQAPRRSLYFGNSGTSVRLLAGILAGQPFDTELIGDESLMQRPMRRIVAPLQEMGADVQCSERGTLPLRIRGGRKIKAISYRLPVASAQLKSCLLLAGLHAGGTTRIMEPVPTRDHTERMLPAFGGRIARDGDTIALTPGPLKAAAINVPADISSAAFFIVAASICPGADVLLEKVGVNPTRHAVIEILERMGADIHVKHLENIGAEPVADIRVRYRPLNGIHIPPDLVPIAIDEFPAILIAAACARGTTVLSDAAELRVKESDRIEAMAEGLRRLGIDVATSRDGMTVTGGDLRGGEINSFGDHRIAMAFAVAAVRAGGPVKILDCINVNTSFPGFVDTAHAAGMRIEVEPQHV
jgi:3-phosphoshikimate 1-carboxyvinyltransferase